ncbi:MAG TPA: D-alanyl-D-alanine carboxypeptidase [Flavisolibacter sp.]|nr:D-alanyl-D-alanine carboxypeptidase [Flavisolibacter sp.]
MRILLAVFILVLSSCSVTKRLEKSAKQNVLQADALQTAHVGISVFEPATGKYWYNYQGDKYFVPASNTKIPTCYAAMKYLGDSLVGLRYEKQNGYINIAGTGDPTFLHPDFKKQPVFEFLKKQDGVSYPIDGFSPAFSALGKGWPSDDYQESYAPERSEMPIYGNVARFCLQDDSLAVVPHLFYNSWLKSTNEGIRRGIAPWFQIVRSPYSNTFHAPHLSSVYRSGVKFSAQTVPFKTIVEKQFPLDDSFHDQVIIQLLGDTLKKKIGGWSYIHAKPFFKNFIHSQPTDSLLKPMMHRSDNFFAEQSLLMASNEALGVMNDAKIIDTLLKTDFKDLPQKPRWVDGSGLSRYNLFTPQDFVVILNKMKNEFGMARIKEIFPTGGEGTLSSYYKKDSTFIYAKTGTLSGVVALSGFLYTKEGKELIFSVLVNNHQASATDVRRAVERFIQGIRERY